jgi:hypothetical protein
VEFTISGTHTGVTLVFELNTDGPSGGTTWSSTSCYYRHTEASTTAVGGANIKYSFRINTGGLPFRIRCSAIATGSVTINAKLWRVPWIQYSQRVWGTVNASCSGVVQTVPTSGYKVYWEGGSIAAASIGGPGTGGATLMYVTSNQCYEHRIANSTEVSILYSVDGGGVWSSLAPGEKETINILNDLGGWIDSGTEIYVAYESTAPLLGEVWYRAGFF